MGATTVGDPHSEVVTFGVDAVTMAPGVVGKVSVKATFGRPSLGFGLVMVKVRVLVPFAKIGLGLKTFPMVGGRTAVRVAIAEPPAPVFVPPSVDDIKPLILVCGPDVVAVTVTGMVQDELPATVPPLNVIVLGAVVVNEPPQTVVGPLVVTVTPAGKVSVNANPLNAAVLELVIVKVNVEVASTTTGLGEKVFARVG
jgi:hypothetical protein